MGLPHYAHQWRHDRDRLQQEVNGLNSTVSDQKATISNQNSTISGLKTKLSETEQQLATKGKLFYWSIIQASLLFKRRLWTMLTMPKMHCQLSWKQARRKLHGFRRFFWTLRRKQLLISQKQLCWSRKKSIHCTPSWIDTGPKVRKISDLRYNKSECEKLRVQFLSYVFFIQNFLDLLEFL